jgi:protein SCO1/2
MIRMGYAARIILSPVSYTWRNFDFFNDIDPQRPRPLPNATLVDQSGRAFRMSTLRGRPILVEFFYMSCPAICGLLASQFQSVFERLSAQSEGPEILLLSVSFDPEHDTVPELADYAARLGAEPTS